MPRVLSVLILASCLWALDAPVLQLEAQLTGDSLLLDFTWTPVEGAERYLLRGGQSPSDPGALLTVTEDTGFHFSLQRYSAPPELFFNVSAEADTQAIKIFTHYMPWFQSPAVSGYWGWHWTMNHFNPENMDATGRREIASHYYPLIGPYDSRDPAILAFQVEQMRLAGVDGVIVDWYGTEAFWDYGLINEATALLQTAIQSAGMDFVICYEDQTVMHMVSNGHLQPSQALSHGVSVMSSLRDTYMTNPSYYRVDGDPLLLCFGPQYFTQAADWQTLFSPFTAEPCFITLDSRLSPVASGAFPWPPMWASVDGVLSAAALDNYLTNFYAASFSHEFPVASSFAAFHDIYAEAGVGESYGYLDPAGGDVFELTLARAAASQAQVIQLVTWNDYGEGTMLEPTVEFGFSRLVALQEFRRQQIDPDFPYTEADLIDQTARFLAQSGQDLFHP